MSINSLIITNHFFVDTSPVCEPHLVTHEIIGPNICGIEPSELIISCTVDYKGNEAPKMEWRRVSDNISVSEGVSHAIIDNKRVVYNLTINENSTVKDGDSFFCSTTRSATSNDGCKSGVLKVKGTGTPSLLRNELVEPQHFHSLSNIEPRQTLTLRITKTKQWP